MAHSRQIFAPGRSFSVKGCFGGSALRSNPKQARPFSFRNRMQVVLRWNANGNAAVSLSAVRKIAEKQARSFGAKKLNVYTAGSTLHVLALWNRRDSFHNFLRALAGLLARNILGAEKNAPSRHACFFHRPFSRILDEAEDAWNVLTRNKTALEKSESRSLFRRLSKEVFLLEQGGPPLWSIFARSKIHHWELSSLA